MLAQAIHITTLVAFAVHAVFGCCGHHRHTTDNSCCTEVVQIQPLGHADCRSMHVDRPACESLSGCVGHPTCPSEAKCADVAFAPLVPLLPCNHSHGCHEVRCSYVNSSVVPVTTGAQSFPPTTLSLGKALVASVRANSVAFINFDASSDPSSVSRCALLQSWQI